MSPPPRTSVRNWFLTASIITSSAVWLTVFVIDLTHGTTPWSAAVHNDVLHLLLLCTIVAVFARLRTSPEEVAALHAVVAAERESVSRLATLLDRTGHLQARTAVMVEGLRDTVTDRHADVAAHARCDELTDSLDQLRARIDRVETGSTGSVRSLNSTRGIRN